MNVDTYFIFPKCPQCPFCLNAGNATNDVDSAAVMPTSVPSREETRRFDKCLKSKCTQREI